MKHLLQILCASVISQFLLAQGPVDLNCIEVDNAGEVTLRWLTSGTNIDYHAIYFSNDGANFDSLDNTPPVSFSYIHSGASADKSSKWYYIESVSGDDRFYSDTLRSIYLEVDNNDPEFNQADLYWNSLSNELPDGYSGWFKILRESPIGNWAVHDSVPIIQLTYSEPVITCYDSITYRIIIENEDIGCSSYSNLRGGIFRDNEYPVIPFFDSVSISAGGYPSLGWTASVSEDVTGYIVYRFENNNWLEIDRVNGRDSTFYTDSVSFACDSSFSYAIAALDSCSNKSPGTFPEPLRTIFLEQPKHNPCDESNSLLWTSYINANPDLEGYTIYFSLNGGSYEIAGETFGSDTTFVHENVDPGGAYSYFVQARFGVSTSSSCAREVLSTSYVKPGYLYFSNGNVLPSGPVELTIDFDTIANNYAFEIWRKAPGETFYQKIDSVPKIDAGENPFMINDENADPTTGSYMYYAEIIDSCGFRLFPSNEIKTIFLTVESNGNSTNTLTWSEFGGWDAGVEQYYIYRMTDQVEPVSPIDSVSGSTLEFIDDVSTINSSNGSIVYWVEGVEGNSNSFGFKARAFSNRTGVSVNSEMFLPNAFRPGGESPEFKPVYRFYSSDVYLLQVFNRWGQLIFESTHPENGWDGTFNGKLVSQGIYVYKLVYQNADQDSVQKNGTITLIY